MVRRGHGGCLPGADGTTHGESLKGGRILQSERNEIQISRLGGLNAHACISMQVPGAPAKLTVDRDFRRWRNRWRKPPYL